MEGNSETAGPSKDVFIRNAKRRRRVHPRKNDKDYISDELSNDETPHLGETEFSRVSAIDHEIKAELARGRRAPRRRNGVRFAAGSSQTSAIPQSGHIVTIPSASSAQKSTLINDRFATQTGQISGTSNKHILAYVDDKLKHTTSAGREIAQRPETATDLNKPVPDAKTQGQSYVPQRREPATLGRLQEVDLGPEIEARNVSRTAAAAREFYDQGLERRLHHQTNFQNSWKGSQDSLNRQQYRRRKSIDMARDSLVEEIISETRTEHAYEMPEGEVEEGRTDDAIAARFHAEYLEQVEIRNNQAVARATKPSDSAAARFLRSSDRDEYAKGPKLGGSRMQRAAMRDKELAAKNGSNVKNTNARR